MKKLLSVILAVVMVAAMSVTAFAGEKTNIGDKGSASINVKGLYSAGDAAADKVAVDVSWGDMEFTYQASGTYWDAATHSTKSNEDAFWTANGNDIKVTNHSNVPIKAEFGFEASVDGIAGKFYDKATSGTELTVVNLNRAEENSALDSQTATVYFVVEDGSISEAKDSIGLITVSIAANK